VLQLRSTLGRRSQIDVPLVLTGLMMNINTGREHVIDRFTLWYGTSEQQHARQVTQQATNSILLCHPPSYTLSCLVIPRNRSQPRASLVPELDPPSLRLACFLVQPRPPPLIFLIRPKSLFGILADPKPVRRDSHLLQRLEPEWQSRFPEWMDVGRVDRTGPCRSVDLAGCVSFPAGRVVLGPHPRGDIHEREDVGVFTAKEGETRVEEIGHPHADRKVAERWIMLQQCGHGGFGGRGGAGDRGGFGGWTADRDRVRSRMRRSQSQSRGFGAT
jgi:hypothetical protein